MPISKKYYDSRDYWLKEARAAKSDVDEEASRLQRAAEAVKRVQAMERDYNLAREQEALARERYRRLVVDEAVHREEIRKHQEEIARSANDYYAILSAQEELNGR